VNYIRIRYHHYFFIYLYHLFGCNILKFLLLQHDDDDDDDDDIGIIIVVVRSFFYDFRTKHLQLVVLASFPTAIYC
jgi:hypothetical protein